jgi:hypothetical protein
MVMTRSMVARAMQEAKDRPRGDRQWPSPWTMVRVSVATVLVAAGLVMLATPKRYGQRRDV